MKKVALAFFVVIIATFNFVFAQVEPTLGINVVPMLTITGNPGERFEIQYSADLGVTDPWKPLEQVSTYEEPVIYCDTSAVGQPKRFYQLVQLLPADSLVWSEGDDSINRDRLIEVDESSDTDRVAVYSIVLKSVGADITIQDMTVSFENGCTTTAQLTDMINKLEVYIDGEQVNAETFIGPEVLCDDLDLGLSEGDSVEMNIEVDLNHQDGNYEEGSSFRVAGLTIKYEDQYGNPGVLSGTPVGGLMVLRTVGATFELVSTSATSTGTTGEYQIRFDLTGMGDGDVYVPAGVDSVIYEVLDEVDDIVLLPHSASLTTTADLVGGHFRIQEEDSERFTLTVQVDNSLGLSPQYARVRFVNLGCRFGSTTAFLEEAPLVVPNDAQTNLLLIQN